MNYCRLSEGEVYLYPHVDGYICCSGCRLQEDSFTSVKLYTHEEAIEHVKEHKQAGHTFPCARVLNRLKKERGSEEDQQCPS
jgi:hypothetical protein